MSLKPCPCGQTPNCVLVHAEHSRPKFAYCSGDCCGDWSIEFRNNYKDIGGRESNALAEAAWNAAPRGVSQREALVAYADDPVPAQPVAQVTKYWLDYYCADFCTLCGNLGRIDTRGVRTAAGVEVGRVNYCICPNGQALRAGDERAASPSPVPVVAQVPEAPVDDCVVNETWLQAAVKVECQKKVSEDEYKYVEVGLRWPQVFRRWMYL